MEENNYTTLISLSEEIVIYLADLMEGHVGNLDENALTERNAWKFVVENLKEVNEYYIGEENRDIMGLAEVQVGLAKYFDYCSTRWMPHQQEAELIKLVAEIVAVSLRIIGPQFWTYAGCGRHEDGACIKGPLGHRFMPNGDLSHPKWPILPRRDAANFSARPHPITLSKDETLYRVVGLGNNLYGNWWIKKDPTLHTKKWWRSGYAVLTSWNSDNFYVAFLLHQSLTVWRGAAASQRVPKTRCILIGGEEQIWIDPSCIPIDSLTPKSTPLLF